MADREGQASALLAVSADPAMGERLSAALGGLGTVAHVSDKEAALERIALSRTLIAAIDERLPPQDVEALLRAVGDPGRVVLLVSEFRPELIAVGAHIQIPRELPGSKLADAVARLSRWRSAANSGSDADDRLVELVRAVRRVRHDINNPLTSVMAETQLILMDADDLSEEHKRGLETIEAMANRIRDLTQELHEITVTD